MIFKEINCDSSSSKDRKIQPLDLTKRKSRELEKQQADTVSRKLDGISPSMYRTYEWVLRQNDSSLSDKDLEKAIWKLHEYRQKKGFIPDKTMVAPDKSDAQMLVGQASHWSSSDTLVSSDKVQSESQDGERLKEKLRESLRSVVQEYRQEGKVRSTAPALSNMTDGQILLEALSHPDWSNRLQKQGVEVNERTLELVSQKLKGMNSPKPSDYNPAVENFNETLGKFKRKDLAVLRVEPAGLNGGAVSSYNKDSQEYYGHFFSFTDPTGGVHIFDKGEWTGNVVLSTAIWSKNQYNKDERLTEQQVLALLTHRDLSIKGWKCSSLTTFYLRRKTFYTDMGTEIDALDFSPFRPYSMEAHYKRYPPPTYVTLEDPTPTYNCHSIFIRGEAQLVSEKRGEGTESQIRRILNENRYYRVDDTNAQVGDIVAYYMPDGSISHTAIVARIGSGGITVESKPGDWGLIQHNMSDNMIRRDYGQPTIYHTDRRRGHSLLTKEEWEAAASQSNLGHSS
jgi:hypothetical protein